MQCLIVSSDVEFPFGGQNLPVIRHLLILLTQSLRYSAHSTGVP